MAAHYYSSTAVATALSAAINSVGATSLTVPEVVGDNGWPTSFPFTLAIDYGTAGVELVDVTSKGILGGGQRGWNITRGVDFTTASTHASGATVRHVIAARDLRAAQALQPDPASTVTQVVQEVVAGTTFTDSAIGDLCIRVAAGAHVLIGPYGLGAAVAAQAKFTGGGAVAIASDASVSGALSAAKFARGAATPFGNNFCYVVRSATFSATNSGWTTIPFATVVAEAFDDAGASLNSAGVFTAPVNGLYSFTAVSTFTSNATGARGIRWVTGSGVVLASPPIALATNQTTNPMSAEGTMYLTAGTTLAAQVYQGSGGSMTMPANATATPQQATFALVG